MSNPLDRVPLTALIDCPLCDGSGVIFRSEVAPGAKVLYGGHTQRINRRSLCRCVYAQRKPKEP